MHFALWFCSFIYSSCWKNWKTIYLFVCLKWSLKGTVPLHAGACRHVLFYIPLVILSIVMSLKVSKLQLTGCFISIFSSLACAALKNFSAVHMHIKWPYSGFWLYFDLIVPIDKDKLKSLFPKLDNSLRLRWNPIVCVWL